MGLVQSKEELLFNQINHHNIEGIKSLHRQGASLEHLDKEGRTPLIYACMNPTLLGVAKTLIELGANVNAYRSGRQGGTPLHHAAKRGLAPTVELLLSHGANGLLVNDDCQTPLEVARAKGFTNVVRMIESNICLFSGWLKELYGPSILERLAPALLSRKVWVVVVPCGSHNLQKPFKLELAIYSGLQEAQPRVTIPLWKADMADPSFSHQEATVLVSEPSSKTRIKLAPLTVSDKQQLLQFCNACKGIPQVVHTAFPFNAPTTFAPVTAPVTAPMTAPMTSPMTAPPSSEDVELAMAINASLQSAIKEGIPVNNIPSCETSTSATSSSVTTQIPAPSAPFAPSAPPAPPTDDNLNYPSLDFEPLANNSEISASPEGEKKGGENSCVVCLDAMVEGACVPCGHMAGCISCLNEIKAKNWGCPICRANIDQVIRVYAV